MAPWVRIVSSNTMVQRPLNLALVCERTVRAFVMWIAFAQAIVFLRHEKKNRNLIVHSKTSWRSVEGGGAKLTFGKKNWQSVSRNPQSQS
jgi:hypothetical protein